MGLNSNTLNSNTFDVPCVANSLSVDESVADSSHSMLSQRTANVLQWLARIRSRLQELWQGRGDGSFAVPTVHFYLTLSNQKHRLQANHISCDDPALSDLNRSTLT